MKKKNISLLLVTLLVMLSSCSEFYSDGHFPIADFNHRFSLR